MTVNVVDTINSRIVYYYYTTGDTLPSPAVTDPEKEHIAINRDDGKKYQWNGTEWKEHASGGGGELPTGWYISQLKIDSAVFQYITLSQYTAIWDKIDGSKQIVTTIPAMSVGEKLTAISPSIGQIYEWTCTKVISETQIRLILTFINDQFQNQRILVPPSSFSTVNVGSVNIVVSATGYMLTSFQA